MSDKIFNDEPTDVEEAMRELHELQDIFVNTMAEIKAEREKYWESLTKDQQLKCFCAVVERIMEGESEGRSYRGILYSTFGFGPEAYAQAQMAGFLGLHNSIFDSNHTPHLLRSFAKHLGIENPEDAVAKFYGDNF